MSAPSSLARATGLTLLGILAGALLVAVAHFNDQKRLVGYAAGESLSASCAPGRAAFFTNRERLAVFMERPDGRVAAQPVYRGGEITALSCDAERGEVGVATRQGERRVAVALARAAAPRLALGR